MKNRLTSFLVLILSFLIFSILLFYTGFLTKGEPNSEKYQTIELYDWNGNKMKLANFRGKILVLDFWATWCEPCKKAGPLVDHLSQKTNPENFIFMGVNTDDNKTLEELKNTAKEFGMNYDSLLDPNLKLTDELKIEGQPALVFIDRNGKLLHKQYGIIASDIRNLLQKMEEWEKQ